MPTSNFLYDEPGEEEEHHPVPNCKITNCYLNSGGSRSDGARSVKCVVMDFGRNRRRAVRQVEFFEDLGEEFAVRVLNVDETDKNAVKVIYELFSEDIGTHFKQLDGSVKSSSLEDWYYETNGEALPIVRHLWRATLECGEKGIKMDYVRNAAGRPMRGQDNQFLVRNPLIAIVNGKPKFFNFFPGDAPKPDMRLAMKVFTNWGNRVNLDQNIVSSLCPADPMAHPLVANVVKSWTKMPGQGSESLDYPQYKLYVPAEALDYDAKTSLVEFFYELVCDLPDVRVWLDSKSWAAFLKKMTQSKNSGVYALLLDYNKKYSKNVYKDGRDIPRCIRNGVKHLKEHYLALHKQIISHEQIFAMMEYDLDIITTLLESARELAMCNTVGLLDESHWQPHSEKLSEFIRNLIEPKV